MTDMNSDEFSIGELADATGLSRRAIRFYVQQRLIDSPTGVGKGRHYRTEHLQQIHRISQLQSAGHSLDEIRQILAGQKVEAPPRIARPRPMVSASLWTRVQISQGLELNFDARRYSPSGSTLAEIRDHIRRAFDIEKSIEKSGEPRDDSSVAPNNGGLNASN